MLSKESNDLEKPHKNFALIENFLQLPFSLFLKKVA